MPKHALVIERDKILRGADYFQGCIDIRARPDLLGRLNSQSHFELRGDPEDPDDIENRPKLQQIIPYVVFLNSDSKIFTYQRAPDKDYDDPRLRGKVSIGVGGHINKQDNEQGESHENPIFNAAVREIDEEFEIPLAYGGDNSMNFVGYINDDSDSVGRAHFGVLAVTRIPEGSIRIKSPEAVKAGFKTRDELEGMLQDPQYQIESWSRIAYNFLTGQEL